MNSTPKHQTARALIVRKDRACYLAIHRYRHPKNKGKWSTVGGGIEPEDASLRSGLKRELKEEFGKLACEQMKIGEQVHFFENKTTAHHFFKVRTTAQELIPIQMDEVFEGRFFSLKELQELREQDRLFFGFEYELYQNLLESLE